MKNLITIIGAFLLGGLVLLSCKTKAKAEVSGNVSTTTCKVQINFGSRGEGINEAKYTELMELLKKEKIKFTEKSVGREGEKEICLPLNELKENEKNQMIERLKKFEDKNTFISLSVN